jgi:hypothetical protein
MTQEGDVNNSKTRGGPPPPRKRKCLVDRSGQRFLDNVRRSSSESILIYVLKKKERTNSQHPCVFVAIKKGKLVHIPVHAHTSHMQT